MHTLTAPPFALPQRLRILIAALAACALIAALGHALVAQVSGDRGIAPVASSTDIEVLGIEVNVTGDNAEDARQNGWHEAQRLAWKQVGGPDIADSRLESLVSAIVVEKENIGPRRYIATLGVIFDRQRAGGLLGAGGLRARSAPMLLLPVTVSGGTRTMYESRNAWQAAWANYQAGASAIDYVRPSGAGGESLLLNFGQTTRRSRVWWNVVLDQFSAADVLVPIANLQREWPGGPVTGRFTARYGPDNRFLGQFTLRAASEAQVPLMLDQAVVRFDTLFTQALASGALRPDPTLTLDAFEISPEVRALIEAGRRAEADSRAQAASPQGQQAGADANAAGAAPSTDAAVVNYTVQVATPDPASLDAGLAGVRGAAGVRSVATTSVAIGGVSVLRVGFAGDLAALAASLRAGGWQVTEGNNALSISR